MLEFLVFFFFFIVVGWIFIKLILVIIKWFVLNMIVGLLIIGFFNFFGVIYVQFNFLNFFIVVIGGILGVFIVILFFFFVVLNIYKGFFCVYFSERSQG